MIYMIPWLYLIISSNIVFEISFCFVFNCDKWLTVRDKKRPHKLPNLLDKEIKLKGKNMTCVCVCVCVCRS